MNTSTAALERDVEEVSEQVRSLAGGRISRSVRVSRRRDHGWQIRARIPGLSRRTKKLSFTPSEVALDTNRIVVKEPRLRIVGAGLENDTLTLLLDEAELLIRLADAELAAAEAVLAEGSRVLEVLTEPARQIAATRAFRAVRNAIAHAPIETLAAAASSATDLEVLLRALEQPDAIQALKLEDPLGPARLRGLRDREKLLLAEGGTLSVEDAARHLNVSRQAINKRRQQGTLLGLHAGRHGYLYPAWQFTKHGTLSGLETILRALKGHDAWARHAFMVSANTRLKDRTPLDVLRDGDVEAIVRAARAFGEHGAA